MGFLNRREGIDEPYEGEFVGTPVDESVDTDATPGTTDSADSWWLGRSYGEPTTFGSQPWHTSRNWWKMPESGEANDIRSQFSTVGRLACAATSLRGNKHRLQGGVNQDSFSVVSATGKDGDSFLVAAVCDGMGSAKYSSFAARMAAFSCTQNLSRVLAIKGMDMFTLLERQQEQFVESLRKRILSYRLGDFDAPPVVNSNIDPGELQTTLSFAVIGPANGDQVLALTGWIGDSPVVVVQDGNWLMVSKETMGEGLYSTASQGLMTTSSLSLRFDDLVPGDALLLCSDGVGNFIEYNGSPTALGQDLRARWASPPDRLEFVRDVSFDVQSADDDRTAVMIWHR